VVGGFGIANIMFVSVRAYKLIGIKVIRNKKQIYSFQFLFEAIILSVVVV
jgi:hypothetical protein